jgi:hypothetical protein
MLIELLRQQASALKPKPNAIDGRDDLPNENARPKILSRGGAN